MNHCHFSTFTGGMMGRCPRCGEYRSGLHLAADLHDTCPACCERMPDAEHNVNCRAATLHRERPHELHPADKHALRIARDTLQMPAPMRGVMGGPTVEQARATIRRLGRRHA